MPMLKITVRGEANAQALFDICHGMGVMWSHPFSTRGAHVLTIQKPWDDLPQFLRNCFPDMKFTTKEF